MTKENFKRATYIDGKAEAVREQIQFDKFKLDMTSLSADEEAELDSVPNLDTGVLVKTNPNKSGSAFSMMKEHAILAGFMRTDFGIKALVVFTERPNDDGSFDFGFVKLSQLKKVTQAKPKKVSRRERSTI